MVLEQLAALPSSEQQASMAWGDRFHLLMQQQQMGLPVEHLLSGDRAFQVAVRSLQTTAPQLFDAGSVVSEFVDERLLPDAPSVQRSSEHLRSFTFAGHSFSVIYDLLLTEPHQAQIIDWKTYPQPQNARWLAEHWQTRLYCYSLVQTSDYSPEQVSMTYWFVRGEHLEEKGPQGALQAGTHYQPQSLLFPYSEGQHQAVHRRLSQALERLERWLSDYAEGIPLPQVDVSQGQCDRCPFSQRCGRAGANPGSALASDWMMTDLASIDEVIP